jgi:beta-lactamase superfamily II metal-dependent hydrolase
VTSPASSSSRKDPSSVVIPPLGFAVVSCPAGFFRADMEGDVPKQTRRDPGASLRRSVKSLQKYGTLFLVDPADQGVVDSAIFPAGAAPGSSFFRYPDGGFWAAGASAMPTRLAANVERAGGDRVWQTGNFEIHMFDAGQGDAQLIIFPSGFTVLIDTCELNWNSGAGATAVAAKLERVLPGRRHIDAAVLSHMHLDHIGYVGYGGIWGLIENHGYTFGKIVDRDGGVWNDRNGDGVCDHSSEIDFHFAGTTSGTATRWLCYATDPRNAIFAWRETADVCSTSQIAPPDAGGMVQILAADGKGGKTHDGRDLAGDYTREDKPPSENGYSLGVLVRFGDIEYVTAGDLDGADASSTFGYTYNDVESVVARRLTAGQTDIYRADHHGSSHSSNAAFVAAMQPTVSLISCGVGNSFGHPSQTVLDRLLDEGDVHITNICSSARDFRGAFMAGGDVVVRSGDGLQYSVSSLAGSVNYAAKAKSGAFGSSCKVNA